MTSSLLHFKDMNKWVDTQTEHVYIVGLYDLFWRVKSQEDYYTVVNELEDHGIEYQVEVCRDRVTDIYGVVKDDF